MTGTGRILRLDTFGVDILQCSEHIFTFMFFSKACQCSCLHTCEGRQKERTSANCTVPVLPRYVSPSCLLDVMPSGTRAQAQTVSSRVGSGRGRGRDRGSGGVEWVGGWCGV